MNRSGVWTAGRAMVRAPLWWAPKLLPVVAVAELSALLSRTPGHDGVPRVVATLVSAIAVAAGAHVINDVSDRESDARAGVANAWTGADASVWIAVLAVCAGTAIAPWLVVPLDPAAGIVLAVLVVTTIAYSSPPLRLKARGRLGVVSDALVSHTLPAAFAMLEVSTQQSRDTRWVVTLVAVLMWSFAFGFRSIVVHQVRDAEGDRQAGVRTYVVARGVPRAVRSARDAVAVEVVALLVIAGAATTASWGVGVFFAVHVALWWFHRRYAPIEIDTVPTTADAWLPFAEFYEVWPAVILGAALAVADTAWLALLVGVIVLFGPAVAKQVTDELRLVAEFVGWLGGRLAVFGRWVAHAGRVTASAVTRAIRRGVAATDRARWAAYGAFWRANRRVWNARHRWIDPILVVVRRTRRRVNRKLRDR